MFETPYQTTPFSRLNLDRIRTGVRRLEIDGDLVSNAMTPAGVKLIPPGISDIPPFHQPLTRVEIDTLEADIVLDGRSLLKADHNPQKLDVYRYAMMYATLTRLWVYGTPKRDFLDIGDFPAKVFANWVSGQISLRLGLDIGQAMLVRACCVLYYIQLHDPLDDHYRLVDAERLMVRTARVVGGIDAGTLAGYFTKILPMRNIHDLVTQIKEVVDSPRTEGLTVAFLYTALGFSWGPSYRETVAVALEYPPAFLALVYSSVLERSYTKTGLGKVIERTVQRGNDREFLTSIGNLTKQG